MFAGAQRRIQPAKIIEARHLQILTLGHVEIIPQRRPLLVLAVKHVLTVFRVIATIEILLRAVIQIGNAARGV